MKAAKQAQEGAKEDDKKKPKKQVTINDAKNDLLTQGFEKKIG